MYYSSMIHFIFLNGCLHVVCVILPIFHTVMVVRSLTDSITEDGFGDFMYYNSKLMRFSQLLEYLVKAKPFSQ